MLGLARGLSSLDGTEDYVFVTREGHEAWLRPYLGGSTRMEVMPQLPPPPPPLTGIPRLRKRLGDAMPLLRNRWHRRREARTPPKVIFRVPFVDSLAPDVVHQTNQNGFVTQVPTIFHPHDLQHVHLPEFFSEAERQQREERYGALCRQAAMVAVASEWTRDDVIQHFHLPPGKVRVVPLAPPLAATRTPTAAERAEARQRLGLPPQYALYPAQTWPHKNHIRLLEALADVRDRHGIVVPLVASGRQNDHFNQILEAASQLGLDDQIVWAGFISPIDLQCLFLEARAVVIPTLFEAASGPLWEAFVSGVPAACSNVTSLPEQAGDAALIFDPMDVRAMADAIARVWTDAELRARLVVAGRERVARLSWETTARIFRAHYRRLAGRRLSDEDRSLVETVYR